MSGLPHTIHIGTPSYNTYRDSLVSPSRSRGLHWVCVLVCWYVGVSLCLCVCVSVYVHVCMCVCLCVYTCVDTTMYWPRDSLLVVIGGCTWYTSACVWVGVWVCECL